jgi:hypothetical protein
MQGGMDMEPTVSVFLKIAVKFCEEMESGHLPARQGLQSVLIGRYSLLDLLFRRPLLTFLDHQ